MPDAHKEAMRKVVESKFVFLPSCAEKTKKLINYEMSTKWRQWKNEIKSRGYDADTSVEEIKAYVPDSRVDKDQWGRLVDY
uniref:Uncharacterized protein n=1 Tax=Nelumbo nucifera TaxID=4432 RepID=A0A822ZCL6_NELNU|nr:TPA_asm: hypothetical protein HUJ06_000513 [Nelumbo nucifera]